MSITVLANGKPYAIEPGTTVARFIGRRALDPRHVVVELNGEPLARGKYGELELEDGDRLELVRAVAGG
jgi:sulfur carrier protein